MKTDDCPITKNPIAENFVNDLMTKEYLAWSLVHYLHSKKLLNLEEFIGFSNKYLEHHFNASFNPNEE